MYEVTGKKLLSGFRVAVVPDSDPLNPRKEWDNTGRVVLSQSCRYDFGDDTATDNELREICADKNNLVLPIYMYEHGGVTINTSGFSCPWDSGMVGVIYMTKQEALKAWQVKILTKQVREKAIACLRAQVETLDDYLTGRVYGYVVFNPANEDIDSCCGFYGDPDECLQEGIAAAEYWEQQANKEKAERHEWECRDVLTA